MDSDSGGETLIWSNVNCSRNMDIIVTELENIKTFVPKVCKVQESTNEVIPEANIDELLNVQYDDLNVYEILTHQYTIISFLSAKFKSSKSDEVEWSYYKPFLYWIQVTSEFIANKFNIPIEPKPLGSTVNRSSYKFCNLKQYCKSTFGNPLELNSENKKCEGEHFVHNKLVNDLKSLIHVMDNQTDSEEDRNNIPYYLRTGLTTTEFVIKHMYLDLNVFHMYLKSNKDFDINRLYVHKRYDKQKIDRQPNNRQHHNHSRPKREPEKKKSITYASTFSVLNNDSESDSD